MSHKYIYPHYCCSVLFSLDLLLCLSVCLSVRLSLKLYILSLVYVDLSLSVHICLSLFKTIYFSLVGKDLSLSQVISVFQFTFLSLVHVFMDVQFIEVLFNPYSTRHITPLLLVIAGQLIG